MSKNIIREGENEIYAVEDGIILTILKHEDGNTTDKKVEDLSTQVFYRNGIKISTDGMQEQGRTRWLVGQLNGVRAYITKTSEGFNIILSDKDLYP